MLSPEESFEDFCARHAKAEARERDQIEIDAIMRAELEEDFSDFMPPRPPKETLEAYRDAIKQFSEFCIEATFASGACLKPGPVAYFLHCLVHNGATFSVVKFQADAISYLSRLNETYDPTTSSLVQAVLRSAETQVH
jgi:hypothetical protein